MFFEHSSKKNKFGFYKINNYNLFEWNFNDFITYLNIRPNNS